MKKTTFGEKILQLRKKADWSQQDLADKLGTHGAIVGKYERDEVKPSIEVAKRIADAFGVSLDYLVDESNSLETFQDKEMVNRLSTIEKLPPEEKTHVLYLLDAVLRDAQAKVAYAKR